MRPVQTPCAEVAETTIVRGAPAGHDAGQRAGDGAGSDDHRQRRRQRARRAERDRERRAVGAVPDARGDPLRRHAAGDLDARRQRRRDVHERADDARPGRLLQLPRVDRRRRPRTRGPSTACGEVSETTFTRATPAVTTVVSNQVVRPGARIFDRIKVTGLGRTPAQVEVRLFGPYAQPRGDDLRGRAATGRARWRCAATARSARRRCACRGRASTPTASGSSEPPLDRRRPHDLRRGDRDDRWRGR